MHTVEVMPWLCVSIYRAFYPSPYYKEEEEGGTRGALSAEDAALVKRGQIVIGLMGAFGFFVECIGSAIHFSWVDNALDAPIIHLVIMHLGKAIILIAGMVLIGLMPAGFDFDEHLATWLCDVYNGWVFYMHRSAICSPFVHINALYATTDLLGEPARQACDEHIRSPTRWVLLSVPILISGLAYLQMLIINWTKVPVPGWPRPSTLFVAFHFATVTTTMYDIYMMDFEIISQICRISFFKLASVADPPWACVFSNYKYPILYLFAGCSTFAVVTVAYVLYVSDYVRQLKHEREYQSVHAGHHRADPLKTVRRFAFADMMVYVILGFSALGTIEELPKTSEAKILRVLDNPSRFFFLYEVSMITTGMILLVVLMAVEFVGPAKCSVILNLIPTFWPFNLFW
jgi:hypothetical protein